MKKIKTYLAGDMLNKGAILLRTIEKEAITKIPHIDLFSPIDNKEINDKAKKPLAERIFETDTNAILESEIIIADISQTLGTTTEIGQIWGINYMLGRLQAIVEKANFEETNEDDFNHNLAQGIKDLLVEIPQKKVYWKTEDIRDTDIEEKGYRRSHSYNQYLLGCLLDVAGEPMKFEEILEEIKK